METPEAAEQIIATAKSFSAAVIVNLLSRMVGSSNKKRAAISHELSKIQVERPAHMECLIEEDFEADAVIGSDASAEKFKVSLCICLSIVPADYKFKVGLPERYIKDVLTQLDLSRLMLTQYWAYFKTTHAQLIERICRVLDVPDLELTLTDDPNKCTFYFDADFQHRIGIMSYYVDEAGQIYHRND